jgi:tyrosyl-tRNA synthetase
MYRYFELLTDVPLAQIEAWKKQAAAGQINPRDLKARLAGMVVADFWGRASAEKAAVEFDRVHKHKEIPADIDKNTIDVSIAEAASEKASASKNRTGNQREEARVEPILSIELIDLLVNRKIFPSRGEAKRVIRQGGLSIDGSRVADIDFRLNLSEKRDHILKVGKRKFYKIRVRD